MMSQTIVVVTENFQINLEVRIICTVYAILFFGASNFKLSKTATFQLRRAGRINLGCFGCGAESLRPADI